MDDPKIQRLHKVGKQLIREGDELEIVRMQVGHRPVMPDGKPIMGRIPNAQLGLVGGGGGGLGGVYTCVGHGPWGISLAPGSGLVMAEILEGKSKTSAYVGLLSVEPAGESGHWRGVVGQGLFS